MRPSTLDVLACPSCRQGYDLHVHRQDDAEILSGILSCPACGAVIPIVEGFPLFTEPRLHAGLASAEAIEGLSGRLFGTDEDYGRYLALKDERGTQEDYAAYGPFNEATRSTKPLYRVLDLHLGPGDFVLDAWCRTGWSGEVLASRYPHQNVIAIWEGDSSVLGYRGFRYWLNHRRRSPNLDILFTDPEKPLPFLTGSFGGLQGQDALHRYGLYPFASECLRVTRKDGCLIFPHVHLTNSEPDPWFDRGCRQDHGLDYRAWLDAALAGDQRKGYVLSEPQLFADAGGTLTDTPETSDYNGAVLIADPAKVAISGIPDSAALSAETLLLLNPLFRISLQRMEAGIDDGWRGGSVGHYLNRHPLYRRHLPQKAVPLSAEQLLLIAMVVTGRTVGDIAESLAESVEKVVGRLEPLVEIDLVLPVRVSAATLELQRFHANQRGAPGPQPLTQLLDSVGMRDEPLALTPDGSSSSGSELREAVAVLAGVLEGRGLQAGDRIVLDQVEGQLGLVLLLASACLGLDITISTAPWQGPPPALWLHADERTPPDHLRHVSLPIGLSGEAPNSLLGLTAGARPFRFDRQTHPAATINLAVDGGRWRYLVPDLIDAAYALRRSADVGFASVGSLADPRSLFVALISLAGGEPFRFEPHL
ncbi:MAG: Trm112 family protein [Caulobacteraceae bacterium]